MIGAGLLAQLPTEPCVGGADATALPLASLWSEMLAREPGYRSAAGAIAAGEALRSSAQREWAPTFSVDGIGNFGQRLSPGEERALGVGPRGEFRVLGTWALFDSDRRWRGIEAERRLAEAEVGAAAFDQTIRAQLAALYLEAALAETVWEDRRDHLDALTALGRLIRARLDAGLDVTWEVHLLDEAMARSQRLFAEADQARAGFRSELSSLAGRCVHPLAVNPRIEPSGSDVDPSRTPAVRHLVTRAETLDALAGAEMNRGAWRVLLLGSTGPNYSRAFDDGRVENEYLAGLGLSWRPDVSGSRRALAAAEEARAEALRAEAESLELELARTLDRLAVELDHAEARRTALERELEQALRREAAALLRWQEGVDRWTEVLQARDRVQEVRLLQVEWNREVGFALILRAEGTGAMDRLPGQLGAGGAR